MTPKEGALVDLQRIYKPMGYHPKGKSAGEPVSLRLVLASAFGVSQRKCFGRDWFDD